MRELSDVLVLAMNYEQDHFEEDNLIDLGDRYFPSQLTKWKLALQIFDRKMNKVRVYTMNGAVGEMQLRDPSEQEASDANTHFIAKAINDAGLKPEDLASIAKWVESDLPEGRADRVNATKLINAIGRAA